MQNNGQPNATQQPEPPTGELTAIRITGQDRIAFLQGQLTQDVARLTPGRPLLAGWANPKGRLLCVPWLADWHDSVWLILPRELAKTVTRRLSMFVLRADVQVEQPDVRVQPAARDQLTGPDIDQNIPEDNAITYCFYNDNEFSIMPAGVPEMGIRIQPGLAGAATAPAALARWRLINIRAGIPSVVAATAEEFVPQMVNLDLVGAISFSKGCYVGQEIVARTQNLGRIKRRMYAFHAATDAGAATAAPGQPVYAQDSIVGQVVDAAAGETAIELLAVIRIDCLQRALSLEPAGRQPLAQQPLPYGVP